MFLLGEGNLEEDIVGDCIVDTERHGGMVGVVGEEEVHRVVPICMQSQTVAEQVGVAMAREVHCCWVSVGLETEHLGYHI